MTNAYLALGLGLILYFIVLRPLFARRIERKVSGLCSRAGNRMLAEPLMERVREGDVQRVRAVFKHCKVNPDMTDERGWTGLRYAIEADNPEMAHLFLVSGAVVNTVWPDGRTPLSLAREKGLDEMRALLESFGARDDAPQPAEPAPAGADEPTPR